MSRYRVLPLFRISGRIARRARRWSLVQGVGVLSFLMWLGYLLGRFRNAASCRLTSASVLTLAALVVAAVACSGSGGAKVDLSKRTDVSGIQFAPESVDSSASSAPLRIAIAGLLTPSETVKGYASFLTYLEEKLGQPVKLVQRRTYAEINALLQTQQLDAALVCPLPYVQGQRAFGMELVAAIAHTGLPVQYSYLIVPSDSGAASLDQLRGKTFAFTDPDSNSGWLAVAHRLAVEGETPHSFFAKHLFTSHHSESVRAVANRMVDGAAVDRLVYDYLIAAQPELASKTKVIAQFGPFPSPAFVVHPDLPPALKERLKQVLLGTREDRQDQQLLKDLQISGFVGTSDAAYGQIREMEARARAAGTVRK